MELNRIADRVATSYSKTSFDKLSDIPEEHDEVLTKKAVKSRPRLEIIDQDMFYDNSKVVSSLLKAVGSMLGEKDEEDGDVDASMMFRMPGF